MQRGASIDAHGLRSLLEFLVAGLAIPLVIVVFGPSVKAPSGPLLLFILTATACLAVMLLAGPFSTVLTLLLVPPLIFSFLVLSEQLNLSAVLEVVALGAVDLAVLIADRKSVV